MEKSLNAPRQGDVLTGRVLLITRDYVIVDINYKCEGQVPLAEFIDPDGNVAVNEGDEIDVYFDGTETDNGTVMLSRAKAEKFKIGVPPRVARGHPSGAQPRPLYRPAGKVSDSQIQSRARQRGGLAPQRT
jgi:hypothetical protein